MSWFNSDDNDPWNRSDKNRYWNRVNRRRRRKDLANHHRKVLKAIARAKAAGVQCPPHQKRPSKRK